MEGQSSAKMMRALGAQLTNLLGPIDVHGLPRETREVVEVIRGQLVDARLDVRDYELAETRAEQQKLASATRERLERLQQHILAASPHGIFGAADVAELSARLQQIISHVT
ncbi:MAG TPA: hypothetical protein VJR27_04625 [Candidatus Saccharimonadales bacterium]|nr:hypothetical protein [Candidatus Saccharimonadales bacterium]